MWNLISSLVNNAPITNHGKFTMNISNRMIASLIFVVSICVWLGAAEQSVEEEVFDATNGVKVKVRMEGPYTADVPLQIVSTSNTHRKAQRVCKAPRSSSTRSWEA